MPGLMSMNLEKINPALKEKIARTTLKKTKLLKFLDKFLAVTAGIIESALISKMPTKLMPMVMVRVIKARSKSCILVWEIFDEAAKSGAIDVRIRGFKNFTVKPITRRAINV